MSASQAERRGFESHRPLFSFSFFLNLTISDFVLFSHYSLGEAYQMVNQLESPPISQIHYPDSDGQPMADNTEQFEWIVVIKENLESLFAEVPDVFVAGDLLWYPVEGSLLSQAPDVMVALGRPKGRRGSYKQWEEGNIAPQVVFEILSPSNKLKEMAKKFKFYQDYGVLEYYLYDPSKNDLTGWQRNGEILEVIDGIKGWISPLLEIRFEVKDETLEIYYPNGEKFLTFVELKQQAETERQRAETEHQRAETAEQQVEAERQRAEIATARIQELEAKLRELGQL